MTTVEQVVEELIDILKLENKSTPGTDITQWARKGIVDIELTDGTVGRPIFFTFSRNDGMISVAMPIMKWTGKKTPKKIVMTYGEYFLTDTTSSMKPLWIEAAHKYIAMEDEMKQRVGDDDLLDAVNL